MWKLNQIEYEIANFLMQRKCPKIYIRSVIYIIWNGAAEYFQSQEAI